MADAQGGGRRKVLIADDNTDAAESLAMLLELMGNEVRTAADGVEAVEAAESFRPDVVVLDIGMPRLDGNGAARRIRDAEWGRRAVLIALTGWGQPDDRRKTAEAGFDVHLTKPVDPTTLDTLLTELCRKKWPARGPAVCGVAAATPYPTRMPAFTPAEAAACRALVSLALAEDLGAAGDRTSAALIPADQPGRAAFVARADGVVAGLPAAALACAAVDPALAFTSSVADGASLARGTVLATLVGPLRSILAAERTALNFLQRLSGVATLTHRYVDAAAGTRAAVLDTRKTTPGWRLLEKYAVRMGGGTNHRVGLYDGVLIKDNHLAGLGGDVRRAVELARAANPGLPVEVEVDTLDQLELALAAKADIVLLDNMPPDRMRAAVARRDAVSPGTKLEASGGINLDTIAAAAATGVDRISVGALTHSAPALDIALDYQP